MAYRFFKTRDNRVISFSSDNSDIHEIAACGDAYQNFVEDEDGDDELDGKLGNWEDATEHHIDVNSQRPVELTQYGTNWGSIEFPCRNKYTEEIFRTEEELASDISTYEAFDCLIYWDGHNMVSMSLNGDDAEVEEITEEFGENFWDECDVVEAQDSNRPTYLRFIEYNGKKYVEHCSNFSGSFDELEEVESFELDQN